MADHADTRLADQTPFASVNDYQARPSTTVRPTGGTPRRAAFTWIRITPGDRRRIWSAGAPWSATPISSCLAGRALLRCCSTGCSSTTSTMATTSRSSARCARLGTWLYAVDNQGFSSLAIRRRARGRFGGSSRHGTGPSRQCALLWTWPAVFAPSRRGIALRRGAMPARSPDSPRPRHELRLEETTPRQRPRHGRLARGERRSGVRTAVGARGNAAPRPAAAGGRIAARSTAIDVGRRRSPNGAIQVEHGQHGWIEPRSAPRMIARATGSSRT